MRPPKTSIFLVVCTCREVEHLFQDQGVYLTVLAYNEQLTGVVDAHITEHFEELQYLGFSDSMEGIMEYLGDGNTTLQNVAELLNEHGYKAGWSDLDIAEIANLKPSIGFEYQINFKIDYDDAELDELDESSDGFGLFEEEDPKSKLSKLLITDGYKVKHVVNPLNPEEGLKKLDLTELQQMLDRAISEEDYELAAKIRDEMSTR